MMEMLVPLEKSYIIFSIGIFTAVCTENVKFSFRLF